MIREDSLDGVVRAHFDYDAGTIEEFDETGVSSGVRNLTPDEVAEGQIWITQQQQTAMQQQAGSALASLTGQITSARTQTEADRAAWATADAATRDQIMDRVFAGLENIIDALEALGVHLGVG